MSDNPYQPPEANTEVAEDISDELASRWKRFFGSLIDGIILGSINFIYIFQSGQFEALQKGIQPQFSQQLVSVAIIFVAFLVLNGYLLYSRGQTIGKLILQMRIVKVNDQPAPFNSLIFLRYVPQWLVSLIPLIGSVFALIDALFIFRADKRCVHDWIAGTKVINARF